MRNAYKETDTHTTSILNLIKEAWPKLAWYEQESIEKHMNVYLKTATKYNEQYDGLDPGIVDNIALRIKARKMVMDSAKAFFHRYILLSIHERVI